MTVPSLPPLLDLAGIAVFALSGALLAALSVIGASLGCVLLFRRRRARVKA